MLKSKGKIIFTGGSGRFGQVLQKSKQIFDMLKNEDFLKYLYINI